RRFESADKSHRRLWILVHSCGSGVPELYSELCCEKARLGWESPDKLLERASLVSISKCHGRDISHGRSEGKVVLRSLDVARDLQIARKPGRDNLFRSTYVLPDGVTHMKGFVKSPDEAKRYLTLDDEASLLKTKEDRDQPEVTGRTDDKRVDLTKNEFSLTNERFLVPEMIFRPADLGMNEAGLAECIVRAVNSCHPLLHPVLYESIILTGGSTLFPRFTERLERELRPLVPDNYRVTITTQENPILGVWRGGSLLASSPDFEAMCVTKADYEELGSARCRKRFLH
ncbi:hypothetical protein NMG60_11013243, partial [Bertholletia excelsa]